MQFQEGPRHSDAQTLIRIFIEICGKFKRLEMKVNITVSLDR